MLRAKIRVVKTSAKSVESLWVRRLLCSVENFTTRGVGKTFVVIPRQLHSISTSLPTSKSVLFSGFSPVFHPFHNTNYIKNYSLNYLGV